MTFRGTVKAGVVVPDDGASLPEGANVRIEVVPRTRKKPARKIMKFAGKAKGLPADASANLKHYLYGHPKR
ncbi:MAG TPA: hypothetical protein VIM11_04485 [Tepidisphaeraceae bacterium]|jgi:hypothetical protein